MNLKTTIEIDGVEFQIDVDFDFQPGEEPDRDSGYPGCAASTTINSVNISAIDILSQLSDDEIVELENATLAHAIGEES